VAVAAAGPAAAGRQGAAAGRAGSGPAGTRGGWLGAGSGGRVEGGGARRRQPGGRGRAGVLLLRRRDLWRRARRHDLWRQPFFFATYSATSEAMLGATTELDAVIHGVETCNLDAMKHGVDPLGPKLRLSFPKI